MMSKKQHQLIDMANLSENSWEYAVSFFEKKEKASGALIQTLKSGDICFTCNVCGNDNLAPISSLQREEPSCSHCFSTVRMRGIIHALSITLFDSSMTIQEFPKRNDIVGKGMSDWDGYAIPLSRKLSYTNSYYHKKPKFDITNIEKEDEGSLDFLISSDVFEHVVPPVSIAFVNARKIIKPGGALILSVPFSLEAETKEHFHDLYDFKIVGQKNDRKLINKGRDGLVKEYTDLIFHGGDGATLEMRMFSEIGLLKELKQAGFTDIKIMGQPCFKYGIYWHDKWSLPIVAR